MDRQLLAECYLNEIRKCQTGNVFNLTSTLKVGFMLDNTGRMFASIIGIIWTCVGFYSFEYMKHEEHNKRYFGFYIIMLGILMGLCFSGNLLSYYAFYEFMTLCSFALVLHNQTREAIMASLKYMFYSFAGAYMVLFMLCNLSLQQFQISLQLP